MARDVHRNPLVLVLHAHRPWVRPQGSAGGIEERWLFDAVTYTYLPLIDRLLKLDAEGVPARLALSVSPTLLAMLSDPLLQSRYARHLERLFLFAEAEVLRLRHEPQWLAAATIHRDTFRALRRSFSDRHRGHLVPALRHLAEREILELVGCPATHAYLPLHAHHPSLAAAQLRVGLDEFQRHFGRAPSGLWLPECGFSPEIEEPLVAAGVRWVVVDERAIAPTGPSAERRAPTPAVTPAGLALFQRSRFISQVVGSPPLGYSHDPDYRDRTTDVAFGRSLDDLRSILPASGERLPCGIAYCRITGPQPQKEPYDPSRAHAKADAHARNFLGRCARALDRTESPGVPAAIVAAARAETFGHQWHEGLHWLEQVLRHAAYDDDRLELVTPAELLARGVGPATVSPSASSWAESGDHAPWLCGENDWLYRPLDLAAQSMQELADRHPDARGMLLRALDQAGRELLLAQASDWPWMMSNAQCPDIAVARAREHLSDFAALAEQVECRQIDLDRLSEIEARDGLFPTLDYRLFSSNENGAARSPQAAPPS